MQQVGHCETPNELLEQIATFKIKAIAVVVYDGETYTTHQIGMSMTDLAIAGELFKQFAIGDVADYIEQQRAAMLRRTNFVTIRDLPTGAGRVMMRALVEFTSSVAP